MSVEAWKAVNPSAKRFKRSAEEMSLGLSPDEAAQRRLDNNESPSNSEATPKPRKQSRAIPAKSGDITIRPEKGVEPEFLENVPNGVISISLDEKWYGWFDVLIQGPFEGDANKLMERVMDLGIGEAATRYHTPEDLDE